MSISTSGATSYQPCRVFLIALMEPSSSRVSCSERFGDPLRDDRRQVLFEDAFDQDSRGRVGGIGVGELLAR